MSVRVSLLCILVGAMLGGFLFVRIGVSEAQTETTSACPAGYYDHSHPTGHHSPDQAARVVRVPPEATYNRYYGLYVHCHPNNEVDLDPSPPDTTPNTGPDTTPNRGGVVTDAGTKRVPVPDSVATLTPMRICPYCHLYADQDALVIRVWDHSVRPVAFTDHRRPVGSYIRDPQSGDTYRIVAGPEGYAKLYIPPDSLEVFTIPWSAVIEDNAWVHRGILDCIPTDAESGMPGDG